MTIYIDELHSWPQKPQKGAERWFGNGKLSAHMTTDGDLEELHVFAELIGLKRSWFQNSSIAHYDLLPSKRKLAVQRGAVEVSAEELIRIYRDAVRYRTEENYNDPS